MIVDTSQCQSCPVGNLPHRSGMKAMFHEKTERGIFNCEAGYFTFFGCVFFRHMNSALFLVTFSAICNLALSGSTALIQDRKQLHYDPDRVQRSADGRNTLKSIRSK